MAAKVILVHGAFCGGSVFDSFRKPFEAVGLTVVAPDLPGHAKGQDPAGLSMSQYVREVVRLCKAEREPPVLIGHSLGGLVCHLAAAQCAVSGLVLLAPSPHWGIYGSTMEEGASAFSLYALGPFWLQSIEPDYGMAGQFSMDRLTREARKTAFAEMRRESGRAMWETLNWWMDPFMTTRPQGGVSAPSLVLVGEKDVIHSPATVKQVADRLGADYFVLPGMSHWLPGEPGWEEVAAISLAWLAREGLAAA